MKTFIVGKCFFALVWLVVGINSASADANFWQSPQQIVVSNNVSNELSAVFASLATSESTELDGRFNRLQEASITQSLSPKSAVTMQYSSAGEQKNYVIGLQHDDLTVSMLSGRGEDTVQLGNDYTAIDPFTFHGGNRQDFEVTGYALDYRFGRFGHVQFGQADVVAEGLFDRRARYLEWSSNRYFARASRFARGGETIGSGLDFGIALAGKRVAVQTMNLENAKRMQRIRFEFDGQKHRQYWLDFSAHQNPLFEANNDYRVMFNFRTLLGAKRLVSYQNDQVRPAAVDDEVSPDAKKKKAKGRGWKRAALIGGGIAAAASLSSSGSATADSLTRFRTQNEAARDVLNGINPRSITLNREFGGWVFVNLDGSFGSSTPVIGQAASVTLPNPALAVPQGSNITASYHTHGAFDPRFDNENFSRQDLESDRQLFIDGYLATPLGQFKLHDVETGAVITLGTVATTE